MKTNCIITIARECGCNGDYIGEQVAKRLEIPFFNKKEIQRLAKENGLFERYPNFLSEKDANAFLTAIIAEGQQEIVFSTPKKVLEGTIAHQPCVIIGRCGNYVYEHAENVVRVFLSGNHLLRIESMMEKHKITKKKAKQLVEETDQRRASFHHYYTGQDWGYAGNYDLCLDESKIGMEKTIDFICQYVELFR